MLKKMGPIVSFSLFFLGVDNFPLRNMCVYARCECLWRHLLFTMKTHVFYCMPCQEQHPYRPVSMNLTFHAFVAFCGIFNNKKCEGGSPVHACFQQLGLFLVLFPPIMTGNMKKMPASAPFITACGSLLRH